MSSSVALMAAGTPWLTSPRYTVLGLIALVGAIFISFFVPDTPMQARFLTDLEKVSLLEHVKMNQTGIENRRGFSFAQVREALLDFQPCVQLLIMILGVGGGEMVILWVRWG